MDLGGGILPILAVVVEPVESGHLHGALRPGGRGVIDEEGAQTLLQNIGVLLSEAGFFRKLNIDRALDLIETEADKVLHAHGVGGTAFVVALTVYTLGDLHILYLHGGDADTLMYRDRAPHTDGHAFCVLKRKYLAERTHVQPCFTGLLCIVF